MASARDAAIAEVRVGVEALIGAAFDRRTDAPKEGT